MLFASKGGTEYWLQKQNASVLEGLWTVTQSDDNALSQEVKAAASGYVQDNGVIESESESDITKRLKLLLKNTRIDLMPSLQSADAFRLKQETEEVNKVMSSIKLNDISGFKNLIKAGATIVCERMKIKKICKAPARTILEKMH